MNRYGRQLVLPELGEAGQTALSDASVTLVGCGGLGNLAAAYLAGAGVGRINLVDHDHLSLDNLHRQVLYTEDDVALPKAEQLARRLAQLNSEVDVVAHTRRAEASLLKELLAQSDLVLDCCDNYPTRYLINQHCVQHRVSLVSAAAIRLDGLVLALEPGRQGRACYACVFPEAEQARAESCSDSGVLGPSVGVVASWQAALALQILTGRGQADILWRWSAASGRLTSAQVSKDPECVSCGSAGLGTAALPRS